MACFHPLHRFVRGMRKDQNGQLKEDAVVVSGNVQHLRYGKTVLTNYEEIPCGKCEGCRADYAREWATRIMLECKKYEHNYMVTLTYDDEHLPKVIGVDWKTGEYKELSTLVPRHVQLFLKKLRKAYTKGQYGEIKFDPHTGIRYYMCGEYGDQKGRAHYHIIFFNLPIPDLKDWQVNKKGYMQEKSQLIENIWGMGLTSVCPVTYEVALYVASYVMKKRKGPTAKEEYELRNQVPEYTNMSRKPGIAAEYFNEKGEKIYETQKIWIQTQKTLIEAKPPRYFDKKYDILYPDKMEKIKKARKELAQMRQEMMLKQTDLTREEYMEVKEKKYIHNLKKHSRQLEQN